MALETDPVDLKIDKLTNELVITDDVAFSTGIEAVEQGLRLRLNLFVGDWFLNEAEGVDYYGEILGQKFNEVRVRGAVRPVILAAPGVSELLSLSAQYDGTTREVTIAWQVKTIFGDTPIEDSLTQVI